MFRYVIVAIVCFLTLQVIAAERPTAFDLLDKYAETQDKLQSYIIKSEVTSEAHSSRLGKGLYYNSIEMRYDGNRNKSIGRCWGKVNAGMPPIPKDEAIYTSFLWDGKTFLRNSKAIGYDSSHDRVMIEKNIDPSNTDRTQSRLRSTSFGSLIGYYYGDNERIDEILRGAYSISVQDKMEEIGGSNCYVIQAEAKQGRYKIWIDPEHGYNIAKVVSRKSKGNTINKIYTLKSEESQFTSMDNVRFEKIDGIWMPVEADGVNEYVLKGGTSTGGTKLHIRRTEIILNPDHDALGSFLPDDVRNGATVYLVVGNNSIKYIWQDGKVVDSQGHEVDIGTLKPPSLLGKALPELAEFDVNVPAQNRMLLVCFWDMEQRPSRDGLQRLSKRAEDLKRKGVDVVAVHASKIEKNKLDTWGKKNNIPFPVGMVQGDEEKTRFTWGVRSMPWLILTDKKHIVTAEGFNIAELDEKLNGNSH